MIKSRKGKDAKGSANENGGPAQERNFVEATKMLDKAAAARKCWSCICLHDSLPAIQRIVENTNVPQALKNKLDRIRNHLVELGHDCLGCEVCYPAVALNALADDAGPDLVSIDAGPAKKVKAGGGWPPLPGNYALLRYQAPVAICILTDDHLRDHLVDKAGSEVAIVGSLQTENLGIERMITNIMANPNIRFLIICGADSKQVVGHRPGQSIMALIKNGIDEQGQIIGAKGKRPVIRNLPQKAVEHFRSSVEAVDLMENADIKKILKAGHACAERFPGPAEPYDLKYCVTPVKGYIRKHMHPDPAGYFVLYADRTRNLLSLEHYRNDGLLDAMIEGRSAAELYIPAIDRHLLSRLDHAAYLGRELARAERALKTDKAYRQDAAPESAAQFPDAKPCGCPSLCTEIADR